MKRVHEMSHQVCYGVLQEYVEHVDEHAVEQMEMEAAMRSLELVLMVIHHRNIYLTLLVSCVVQ